MLRIYESILDVIRRLRPIVAQLERRDPDLARQMRRAVSSVALQVAEGSDSRGKNRLARYHGALGSIRETKACLDVAMAFGYSVSNDEQLLEKIDHVTAVLVRVVHG